MNGPGKREQVTLEHAENEQFDQPQSDLIIAIEEPEIYQHPTKQRLFGKLLRRLSEGYNKETGIRIQTIFVTHSPLLISLPACEGIRIVRRVREGSIKNVRVNEISLQNCAVRSAIASGRKPEEAWSATQYAAKLHTFDAQLAEGFFGRCVVVVEGVGDQSVLDAWYRLRGRDAHAEGIVIASVTGKNNLDRPIVIFSELGIPCYWIFDNDKSDTKKGEPARIRSNRLLQRLGGLEPEDCVDWPEGCCSSFACWDSKLEKYVRTCAGAEGFQAVLSELAKKFDIEQDVCLKFPASAAELLSLLTKSGVQFPQLDEVLGKVDGLISSSVSVT